MSGQHGQGTPAKIPKSSPNSKIGPMKATIPMSSVLKQTTARKCIHSPTISPNFHSRTRTSPDPASGQRSPGSAGYKGKSKTIGVCDRDGNVIRRTASLDTIYLKGHWPRDNFHWHTGILQIDKATQTDELDSSDSRKIQPISENEELFELLLARHKQRSNKESNGRHVDQTLDTSSQTLASCISPTFKMTSAISNVMKPKSFRSSVEGLNQEIERIVLKTDSIESRSDRFCQNTPDGHRAPLAEILKNSRSRSVNTQTPNTGDYMSSCPSSGDSHGSSPDQESGKFGTSPHINKFLAREPPDGCEKVQLKSLEERKCVPMEHMPQPSTFKLKPSLGSAFQILQPILIDEQDLPTVPPTKDFV